MTKNLAFLLMLATIAAVSLYDAILTARYENVLHVMEENPIARMILEADGWRTTNFLTLKATGTVLALTILAVLYRKSRRFGLACAAGTAGFQVFLLAAYLL